MAHLRAWEGVLSAIHRRPSARRTNGEKFIVELIRRQVGQTFSHRISGELYLNLIANGFYATKRKAEANDGEYEPTLAASTKNLGDQVEIRIRDNGTGIPPDVKEKMFEPFFTTKPTGEGTGLGLSISHDIIVKQHAGTIEVDTQPGSFTEIRIILPRTPAFV
jgi:signal transduction histidine kinase